MSNISLYNITSKFVELINKANEGELTEEEYNELGNEVLPIQYDSLRFSYPEYPESIYAKSIRVLGKIGDERERDLIDYGVKNDNNTKHGRCSTYERTTYERYGGTYAQDEMGYSDDDIDTIFDGDPDAYWNID